jgi:hypothetical protein
MKKLTLIAASLIAALNIYAQGDVIFDNFGGGVVHNTRTGADVTVGDGIVVQLYASMTAGGQFAAVPNSIFQVGVIGDGFFDGGVVRIPSSIIGPGATAFMEVRAWESAYGATFEEAVAAAPMGGRPALRGRSNGFSSRTGDPTAVPPGTPVPLSDLVPGFSVDVPEPSVIALGLIGAGALLVLRRRK